MAGEDVGAAGRRRFLAGGSGAAASSGRRCRWSSGAQTNHRKITKVRKNVVKLMGQTRRREDDRAHRRLRNTTAATRTSSSILGSLVALSPGFLGQNEEGDEGYK